MATGDPTVHSSYGTYINLQDISASVGNTGGSGEKGVIYLSASVLHLGQTGSAAGVTVTARNISLPDHDGSAVGLSLGGTLVTSTAAELNKLDACSATTAELNYVDVTPGTGTASKALVLDGSRDVDTINALGIASMASNWTNASRTVADMGTVTTMDLNGGSIDGTTIGAASAGAGTFLAVAGTTGTFSGILKSDDATEATTTTDGSLQTDGGLSVAKSAVVGDDLDLLSDSCIVNFGADKDITLTHTADTGLTMAGSHANGTNLKINNTAADGDARVEYQLGGTTVWSMGIEDGDSDKFVIEDGAGALGADPAFEIAADKSAKFFGTLEATTSFTIGSAAMTEADLEKLDGITNGTAAASKAVVLDGSKNIATIGTIGCGAITSTGASSLGSISSVGAVTSTAAITAATSFIIGSADLNEADMEKLDGITNGVSAASKAMVTDADGDIYMPDSDKFELGAGSDMQLYHDGTNSYIANKTGALKVATETSGIAVTIGHSTSEVTVADNLTVSGNLTVTGTTITDSVEVISTSSGVLFEGGTDDGHEGTLISAVAGADVTYTLPNLTGHIPLLAGAASNASVTAAEFALLDGGSSVATVTVADGDGVMFNDAGTMKQCTVQSLAAYFDDEITAMPNLVTTAATTVGTIASGVWAAGAVTSSGRIVSDDATEATSTTDGSLQTDGGLSVAKSAVIGDDLDLLSDGAIMNFGASKEINLTHVADAGLLLNAAMYLSFRDSALKINSSADGQLDLTADATIALNAPDVLIESSTSDKPQLTIKCTNADANPGTLLFNHDSASPADDDELGEIAFNGDDDAGNSTMFAKMVAVSTDVSNGSEDGELQFKLRCAGAVKEISMGGGAGLTLPNDSTYGVVKAHSLVTYSDESLKTNIQPLGSALEMVNKLQGVSYDWKSDGSADVGFIAQDVKNVVPQIVYGNKDGEYALDYSKMTSILVEAMKEQQAQINDLKAKLDK